MAMDEREEFKEMELWEHLAELRSRLIRSAVYLLLGVVIGWALFDGLWAILFAPLKPELAKIGGKPFFPSFTSAFMLRLQVSLIAGVAAALPFVTLELWGFVSPGLTRNERKVCRLVFPLSVCFFILGMVVGYAVMAPSIQWFLSLVPKDSIVMQDPTLYMTFMAKMILAFGITFQLPLILMALCYIGLVTSKMLADNWRIAVVGCVAISAIATPGGDPFSMVLMGIPLVILYGASIILCRMVEGFKARQDRSDDDRPRSLATASSD